MLMVCSTLSLHEVIFLYIFRRFLLPDGLPDDDSLASGSLLGLPDVVDVDLSLHGHAPATAPPVCNWSW